jgi:hypothetical protein
MIAPWMVVALLIHAGVLVLLYAWSPPIAPPGERLVVVSLRDEPNPFDAPSPGEPSAEPAEQPAPAPPPPTSNSSPAPTPAEPHQAAAPEPMPEDHPPTDAGTPGDADGEGTTPGRYAARRGPAKGRALQGYGGGEATESAVRLALEWLARHQREDGAWDRTQFNRRCPVDDVCREVAVELTKFPAEPAITGLAVLAYLGAGHTDREGDFPRVVERGLAFLLSQQRPDGSFAASNTLEMYNHAIATLALAEAHAMTGEPALRPALTRAIGHIVRAQQPGGGWGYTSQFKLTRDDMSVTGWVVMALAAAKSGGVEVPDETLLGVAEFVSASTISDGRVNYAFEGRDRVIHNSTGSADPLYSPAMTGVGMLVRQLLGVRPDAPVLQQQASLLLADPPDVARRRGGDRSEFHSDYYWYYGSLAMFNQGGGAWSGWNEKMVAALLASQDRSVDFQNRPRCAHGSFAAFGHGWGKWGRAGGKVYSTALGALMLESYYRHVPTYLTGAGLISESTLRLGLSKADANRNHMVELATYLAPEVAEPVLLELLQDAEAGIRLRAGLGLVRQGSPMGLEVMRAGLGAVTGAEREIVARAIESAGAIRPPASYGRVVRVDAARGVVVFETLGEVVYAGCRVVARRDGADVAIGEVTRRVTSQGLAAARLSPVGDHGDVAIGDVVSPAP